MCSEGERRLCSAYELVEARTELTSRTVFINLDASGQLIDRLRKRDHAGDLWEISVCRASGEQAKPGRCIASVRIPVANPGSFAGASAETPWLKQFFQRQRCAAIADDARIARISARTCVFQPHLFPAGSGGSGCTLST